MSSKFLEFKASDRSERGLVDTRISGKADLEVGTSGSYRTFDADLETSDSTSQKNTSDAQPSGRGSASANASVTLDLGTSSSVGGVGIAGGSFQSTGDRGSSGKGEKHQRDSSSDSSSSSSSSDEGGKESAKAKRKKKKKRKGILSGSFLPKFGASKKSSRKDDSNRTQGEVALGVTPPSGNVKDRPPSAEVQTQAAFDSSQDNTHQNDGSRPDVEIFSGIGADERTNTGQIREEETLPESSKDDLFQGSLGAAPGSHDPLEVDVACGTAWLPEASMPPFVRVTVTASSVDKFPPPEIRPVDDGTDVDLGFALQLDGEYDDPNIETMDTTDLLSQIENTINSIEAAQQQQAGTLTSDLEVNVDSTLSISANTNPHSVDIPAVDDLETSAHIHLPKPKDGPILELPEDTQVLAGSNLPEADADRTDPDVSLQISSERRSHSPSSSSRSSSSEKGPKSKNFFPSFKFHMPKREGKNSPGKRGDPGNVSIDAEAEKDFDGIVPLQPDLVLGASDVSMEVETSHDDIGSTLPDQDQRNDLSLDTSFNITGTPDYGTSGKDVRLGGGLNINADLNRKEELERDDSSDIDAYLGGAAIVALPSVDGENGEAKVSLNADPKATSKGKPKKGKLKMPKFKKSGSKKARGDVDVPIKVSADLDMDVVETPDANSDIDVEISVSDGPSRPAFEVVGKRASLKRDVAEPNIEMPVSQEVQLVVESKPPGDFEVSLPAFGGGDHLGVGPSTPDGSQQNGFNDKFDGMDGGLHPKFDGNVSSGVEIDGPGSNHLKDGLNVRGGLDMDDTSDIEAYFDPPKMAASPAVGGIDVNMSMENPNTSARVKTPYNKGKAYRKGNRNTPKFKSKPSYGVKAGLVGTEVQSPNVTLSSDVDVDKSGPSGDFEMNMQSPGAEASTEGLLQTPKADVKASVSEPNLAYDGEAKRKGFTLPKFKMPKFKKRSRKSSKDKRASGSFDAEMGGALPSSAKIGASSSMPDISYGAKGQTEVSGQASPDFDGPISPSSPHVDTDERKKKRWSGGFKFPSFGLPKFGARRKSQSGSEDHDISTEVDVSFNKPQVGGVHHSRDDSINVDGNLHVFPEVDIEANALKKDNNLEYKIPLSGDFDRNIGADIDKPSDKSGIGVNIDTDVPNIESNIEFAAIEGESTSLPTPDYDADIDMSLNSAINPSAKMPSVQMQGVVGPDDFGVNVREDGVELPDVSSDMVGEINLPSGEMEVDIPKGKIDIDTDDHDVDMSGNNDEDIDVPQGVFGIRGDIRVDRSDVEAPDGEIGLDVGVGGNIDMPEVGIKMKGDGDSKSVTSSSSSSSSESDDKKKKKGFFGSLHLPRFGGKGRTKKPKGPGVDIVEGDDIAFKLDKPTGTIGMDDGDIVAGAEIVTPEISVSQKEIKPDFNVDISKPDIELPDVSGKVDGRVDLPSGNDGNVEVHIPTGKIDIDTGDQDVEISGDVDGDIDVPRGDFDIGGDIHAPRGDVNAPTGDISLDVGVGENIDTPEVRIKMKGDRDDKSVTSTSSSSCSESDEKNKKKGFFGSFHLPKFGGKGRTKKSIGTGVSFDRGDDVEVDFDRPQVKVDMDRGDSDLKAEVVLPEISVMPKEMKADIDADIPKPYVSGVMVGGLDVPSGEFDVDIPKGKIDIDTGDYNVDISSNNDKDIDVPTGDFGIAGDVHAPRGDIEAPSGNIGLDVGVGGNIDMPEVGIRLKGDGDNKSVTSSSSSSSSGSDDKKKKTGFFGSFHLPRFGGKGRTKKPKGPGVDIEEGDDIAFKLDKPTGTIDMDDGDIVAGAEIVTPEISVSQKEIKPDFDVDISKPDVSGNNDRNVDLPRGDVEVDIPTGKIDIDTGDQDVNISGNVDGDIDVPRGDFGIAGDAHAPRGDVEVPSGEIGLDVGVGGNIDMPEVGIKMKGDGDNKSVTSSSSSSSSDGDGKKKKGFFGSLHLPKFGGKGRTKKSIGTGVSFDRGDDMEVDIDIPQLNVDLERGDPDIGAEVNIPEMSVLPKEMKPDIDVDISKPDVDLPDVSGDMVGVVDAPSGELEVDIPKTEINIDTGDHDVDISGNTDGDTSVPRGHFGIGGDIGAPRGDVEAPSGEVGLDVGVGGNIDMPEVGIRLKGDGDDKSITSSSSSSSSESDEKKKKKGFFGSLHLPKFGGKGRTKKPPKGPGVDIEEGDDIAFKLDKPTGTIDVDDGDIVAGAEIVTPEISVSQKEMKPDFDVNISKPDLELPDVSGNIDGTVDFPSREVGIPTGKIDTGDHDFDVSGNVDGDIDVPRGDFDIGGDIHAPRGEVEVPSGEVGLDVGVKGNIDMPEMGIKMKGDGDNKSVTSSSSSSSSESDKKKKKKGFFGSLHLPKFGGKGRTKKSIGTGVSFDRGDDMEVDVDRPQVNVDTDRGDSDIGAEVNIPEMSVMPKEMKADIDVDISKPDVDLPDVSGDTIGGVDVPSSEIEVDIPKTEIDIDTSDHDVDVSGNIDGGINLPKGDFGIGGDFHAPRGDAEASSGEIDLDLGVGGNIDMPEVGIKMKGDGDDKSVTSSSSSSNSESDDKKKKKGFFGSLHLPKFGGKGRTKKPKGPGVDIEEGDDIAFKLDKPTGTIDVDDGDLVAGAEIVTPEISVSQKEMKSDFDVDISKPDVSGNIDGRVDLPSGDVEVNVPTGKIDIDTGDQDVEISGDVDGDIDVPRGDFDMGGDIHAPRGEVEVPSGEVGLDVGVGGNLDMPEVGIKMKGDGDDRSVTSSSSSSSSRGGEKKKKGFFGSLHLPKFGGKGRTKKSIGTGVSFDRGDDVEVDIDRPRGSVDMDQGDIDIGAEVVMPEINVSQKDMKPDMDVDISKPDLPDISYDVDRGVSLPSGGVEVNIPTGKVDIDTGDQDLDISGNVDVDVDESRGDFGVGGDIHAPRGDVEAPSGEVGLDVGVGGNIDMPEVGIRLKGDGDDKSITSSSSSSSSESDDKKKKKGFFGSLHLPKFGGKGQTKRHDTDVPFKQEVDSDFDLKRPKGKIDLDLGDIDSGAKADIPDMSVGENETKVDVDMNFAKPNLEVPNVSANVDAGVELPKDDAQIDAPIGSVDIGVLNQEVEMPERSLDLDKGVGVNFPDIGLHSETPDRDLCLDGQVEVGVSVGGDIDYDGKDKSVDLPHFGVGSKGEGDDKSVTSSSSSEEEKKEKKGLFGGLHLPKLGFHKRAKRKSGSLDQGGGVDVNIDDHVYVSTDPSLADVNPEVSVEVQADKGDVDVHGPEVGGTFDDPDMQVAAGIPSGKTISDVDIDHGAPDVDITIRGASGFNGQKGEGDIDLSQKADVDVDRPEVKVEGSFKSPSIDKPSIDVDVGKVDLGSDVPGNKDLDIELPVGIKGTDVSLGVDRKLDSRTSSTSSSSSDEEEKETPTKKKKKGFLPFHLPKIQLKRPKSPEKKKGLSPANVEVKLKTDVDLPDTNVSGALVTGVDISDGSLDLDQPNIEFSGPEKEIDLSPEVEEPEIGVSVACSDKPKLNLSFLGGVNEPDLDIDADVDGDIGTDVDVGFDGNAEGGMDQNVAVPKFDVGIHRPNSTNVSDDDLDFEKFGKMLGEASFRDADMGDSLEVNIDPDQEDNIEVESEVPVFQVNKDLNVDFDVSKQLGIELAADEGRKANLTPNEFNAGVGLTRSSSKSSVTSSSSEEEVKPKKSKGFLTSLKFPKLTSGKGLGKEEAPRTDGRGDIPVEVEENIAPSLTVDIESAPPVAPSKVETKSPKGKLGLFKKGKTKKGDSPRSHKSDSEVQADQGADVILPSVNVSLESTPPKVNAELGLPSASSTPGNLDLSGAFTAHSMPTTPQPTSPSTPHSFSVVVAIDFGTTFSGYAYSFTEEPDDVHVMRKWEGGDPGVINMKTLTTLLLTPEGEFHSFGFSARDFYHDMNFTEAQKWLYFDKYKLTLHDDQNLNIETELVASNGKRVKALTVFTHTLKFFKNNFLEELMDLSMDDGPIDEGEIRWVLTVPAIWRQPAKQFMRQAAYQAGIASPLMPNQLLIALEPEAASIYIGKLSMKQLMPERMALKRERWLRGSMGKGNDPNMKVIDELKQGSRYVVVDCGGGTVDITVHEWEQDSGTLKELHKASGGTFGSINVDEAFINLLVDIFGNDFIDEFKVKRPAGWVDLLLAFEARKRNANPWKANYLNVSLPFSFIDYYKKFTNGNLTVDKALMEYNSPDVSWCGEAPGMLRFSQDGMFKLFQPTTDKLITKVDQVLEKPELGGITHLFLAGGFAESPLLQHQIREKYKDRLRVVIPQDVGLATLKGAVMYGQNPKAVSVRRTRLTYGVGALNKFNPQKHPEEKKIVKDGKEWCKDVFDVFVYADQSVTGGDTVTRSYAPASTDQEAIKVNIYCTDKEDCQFITDEQVRKCGTLTIDLRGSYKGPKRRELQLSMQFGDTEVKVDALDVATGKKVEARVDFLNN